MHFITLNHIAEFLALLTSLIFYSALKKGKLKSLPFFLLFILLVELAGRFLAHVMYANNAWLYNLSIPVEYCYYLYLFSIHTRKPINRITGAGMIVLIFIALLYFVLQPVNHFHYIVLQTAQVMVIVASCMYIYQVFRSDDLLPLYRHYFFWLMTGLFLFNLGDFTYFFFFPLILQNNLDSSFDLLFKQINNNLLLLLYLTYIISIILYRNASLTKDAGELP